VVSTIQREIPSCMNSEGTMRCGSRRAESPKNQKQTVLRCLQFWNCCYPKRLAMKQSARTSEISKSACGFYIIRLSQMNMNDSGHLENLSVKRSSLLSRS
jgi:hypothetical protein